MTPRDTGGALHKYYDHLRVITRGPIFTRARFRAIWAMNTNEYQPLLDEYERRQQR